MRSYVLFILCFRMFLIISSLKFSLTLLFILFSFFFYLKRCHFYYYLSFCSFPQILKHIFSFLCNLHNICMLSLSKEFYILELI